MYVFNQTQKELIIRISVLVLAELNEYEKNIQSGEQTIILGVSDNMMELPPEMLLQVISRIRSQTRSVIKNPDLMLTHSDEFDISRYTSHILDIPQYEHSEACTSALRLLWARNTALRLNYIPN